MNLKTKSKKGKTVGYITIQDSVVCKNLREAQGSIAFMYMQKIKH